MNIRKLACGVVCIAAMFAVVRSAASSFLDGLATNANKIAASDYASGGDIIWRIGNDYIHIFTNTAASATFTPVEAMSVRVLMVGGGGSGGSDVGGGGGAGGMVETNGLELVANTAYTITVGAGGALISGTASAGNSGGDSSMSLGSAPVVETAKGGGGGGAYGGKSAKTGGSGGGASQNSTTGASGTAGQGNKGGNYSTYAGGGGGAGGAGGNGSSGAGGAGGAGRASDILTYSETFAGGGGGGTTSNNKSTQAAGGTGGGGKGGYQVGNTRTSTPCEDGLGAGGGGAGGGGTGNVPKYGAAGGSGIVIIRYHRVADGEKDIVLDPQVVSGLVYDGTVQTGVVAGVGYTLTGDTATSAGQHVAIATLTDPDTTEWTDHTTDPKNVEWSIAQAENEWTTAPALSKTWWMNEHDTPATVTMPVAKFGGVAAMLNDAAWDGSTLPTVAGDYAAVWTVAGTTDYAGLCTTNNFTVSDYIASENRAARYSADGVDWTGADSFAAAVAAAPNGGIVELNTNESVSAQVTINKSLTIRSCSARQERYELQLASAVNLLRVDASGKTVVISNLVANGNSKGTDVVWLQAGTLTLGRDLVLKKGGGGNGRVVTIGGASTVLNLDGVTISNSNGNYGLVTTSQSMTINLFDCTVTNTSGAESSSVNEGSVLNINNVSAVLNVYGGTITNNRTKATYGQVYSKGKVYFKGGKPVIEDFGVANATRIQLDGTLDNGASVGVLYGAAEGDAFGQYVSGDSASARAFYLMSNHKLKGAKRGTNLVWGIPSGLCIILR